MSKSSTEADPLTVGIGFFLGVLIGAVIAIFCAKLCLKDIARSKVRTKYAIHGRHLQSDLGQCGRHTDAVLLTRVRVLGRAFGSLKRNKYTRVKIKKPCFALD